MGVLELKSNITKLKGAAVKRTPICSLPRDRHRATVVPQSYGRGRRLYMHHAVRGSLKIELVRILYLLSRTRSSLCEAQKKNVFEPAQQSSSRLYLHTIKQYFDVTL